MLRRLQQLIETNSTPACILSPANNEYRVIQVNKAFSEMASVSGGDLLLKQVFEIAPYSLATDRFTCKSQLLLSLKMAMGPARNHQVYLRLRMTDETRYFQVMHRKVGVPGSEDCFVMHSLHEISRGFYYGSIKKPPFLSFISRRAEDTLRQTNTSTTSLIRSDLFGSSKQETVSQVANTRPFIKLDAAGKIVAFNAAAALLFRFDQDTTGPKGSVFSDYLDKRTAKQFVDDCSKGFIQQEIQGFDCYDENSSTWLQVVVCPGQGEVIISGRYTGAEVAGTSKTGDNQQFLRVLIDSMPDTIYFKDINARKTISNRQDYELLGAKKEEEVLGKTDLELLQVQSASVSFGHDFTVLTSGVPLLNMEEHIITATGKERWLLTSKIPLFDEKGMVAGLLGIGRDITARKRIELEKESVTRALLESEKKYSDLFNLSPLPIWLYDKQTLRFLNVNQKAISHYGYTRKEFLSMTIKDIRPVEDIPHVDEWLARGGAGPDVTFRHLKKNGELIYVNIHSYNIRYNGIDAKLIAVTDITRLAAFLGVIRSQNERLHKIAQVQAHEVRAPLARILGLVKLLSLSSPVDNEMQELIKYLNQASSELDTVIRNVCDASYEERTAFEKQFSNQQISQLIPDIPVNKQIL